MRELHLKFLQSRKSDLINLVKCPDTVINVLINCNIISQDFTFKSFTFETVIDEICHHSNHDLFLLFILILLLTGNFKAYSIFLNIMDKATLKKVALPDSIKTLFNPMQLMFITPTPSLPAKQCLRKFSLIQKMSEKKKAFLQNLLNLMELNLNLEPVLVYFKFYEIFFDEQIAAIKGSKNVIKSFVDYLGECPDIAFERFTHALVLSEQWILFSILQGGGLMDLSLLEEISKIHMELILDNNNNKENSSNIFSSYQNSISFQDPITLNHSIEKPPKLPENFEVDETDSKILASLYQKDEVYPNFSSPKGLALIINNREFANNQYNPRTGTEVDEENIRKLLFKLGYQVERTHKNLSAESMLRSAKIFAANEAHKNFDSCVVVVLTHGQYDHFIGSDGDGVNVHDFLGCFNAKNARFLKGKPKLFFFQACRGDNHDYGTDATDIGKISSLFSCMRSSPTRQRNFNNNTNNNFESSFFSSPSIPSPTSPSTPSSSSTTTFPVASSLRLNSPFTNSTSSKSSSSLRREKRPTEGDMVIAFATTPRYVSWRNSNSGSWFIQSICEIFGKFAATEDIGSLLIKVNKRVADAYQSSSQGQKQIPEFVIRLQKKFYFFPGIKAEHLQQS